MTGRLAPAEDERRIERFTPEDANANDQMWLREECRGLDRTEALAVRAKLEFSKDYDRVLYSSGFRKLAGVTQVVASYETALFHNRLTHSLKVAQTGSLIAHTVLHRARAIRSTLAEYGGLSPRVVRAACIAHDLGHPPFGHIGEQAIQYAIQHTAELIAGYAASAHRGLSDGFEGNAQSFRIVTRLAFRDIGDTNAPSISLNLTRATLSALCKYPWKRENAPTGLVDKWGAYDSDSHIMSWALENITRRTATIHGLAVAEQRTIEAQVMDWADDISYAVHDVEDFYRAGLVPLDALSRFGKEFENFVDYAYGRRKHKLPPGLTKDEARTILEDKLENILPGSPYIGSRDNRAALHNFASTVIRGATRELSITQDGILVPDRDYYVAIELLKQAVWYYVIDRPSLSSAQRGQREILLALITKLWTWAHEVYSRRATIDEHYRDLPPRLVDYILLAEPSVGQETQNLTSADVVLRGVVDYVASLTENQALQLHQRLSGSGGQSMLESWLFL